MKAAQFLDEISEERIVAAIRSAESLTTAEIRLVVTDRKPRDPIAEARRQFEKLGMSQTAQRNGLLILIVPRSQRFAVIGDAGIHARCGDVFWNDLVAEMTDLFKQAHWNDGILLSIRRAGELLQHHFPASGPNPDELPNDIVRD